MIYVTARGSTYITNVITYVYLYTYRKITHFLRHPPSVEASKITKKDHLWFLDFLYETEPCLTVNLWLRRFTHSEKWRNSWPWQVLQNTCLFVGGFVLLEKIERWCTLAGFSVFNCMKLDQWKLATIQFNGKKGLIAVCAGFWAFQVKWYLTQTHQGVLIRFGGLFALDCLL